ARMRLETANVGGRVVTTATVFHTFGPGFSRFRAVFEPIVGVGLLDVDGTVTWTSSSVSGTAAPAVPENIAARQEVILSATTSGVPPAPRLQFIGPARLNFTGLQRGTGSYEA
ncbi:hypothetical protein B0H13DRAFT_1661027, partial [Mycena leptocephala]